MFYNDYQCKLINIWPGLGTVRFKLSYAVCGVLHGPRCDGPGLLVHVLWLVNLIITTVLLTLFRPMIQCIWLNCYLHMVNKVNKEAYNETT